MAFSCKRRGFCPFYGARRMAQTAAHLVEHVIDQVPVQEAFAKAMQLGEPLANIVMPQFSGKRSIGF